MTRLTAVRRTRGASPSHSPPDMTFAPTAGLSHYLGWFSIGLGAAQLFAPEEVCRWTGIRNRSLMQLCGLREVATGIAILSSGRPTLPMWCRVAGDAFDLAVLGEAVIDNDAQGRTRATEALLAVAGVTALDVAAATGLSAAERLEG